MENNFQRKNIFRLIGAVVAVFALFVGIANAFVLPDMSSRKIVVFQSDVNDGVRESILEHVGGIKIKELRSAHAKVANLNRAQERSLILDPRVLRIDDDIVITAVGQTLPWGIANINANKVWVSSTTTVGTTGAGVKVAVIDTGIDLSHPDLKTHIKGGYNAIRPWRNAQDDNGHGTHVAGIIGAINNTIGVVGAAPDVNLYAVKVLDRNGSGWLSDIIEGMDWAIANNMRVINMSFGSASGNQSFADAVQRVNNAGIVQVAAAGNENAAVIFPAAYPQVIAVAATDVSNARAYFSNYGPEVDLSAPGVSIYSTYKGSSYATLSGTSMASPHVAGVAALVISKPISPAYDTNSNSLWDPFEVQTKIQDGATDIGVSGVDVYSGYGLVNALLAVL